MLWRLVVLNMVKVTSSIEMNRRIDMCIYVLVCINVCIDMTRLVNPYIYIAQHTGNWPGPTKKALIVRYLICHDSDYHSSHDTEYWFSHHMCSVNVMNRVRNVNLPNFVLGYEIKQWRLPRSLVSGWVRHCWFTFYSTINCNRLAL